MREEGNACGQTPLFLKNFVRPRTRVSDWRGFEFLIDTFQSGVVIYFTHTDCRENYWLRVLLKEWWIKRLVPLPIEDFVKIWKKSSSGFLFSSFSVGFYSGMLYFWILKWMRQSAAAASLVSLAAVLCLVTQRSSPQGGALRDDTKNGCEGDYCKPDTV